MRSSSQRKSVESSDGFIIFMPWVTLPKSVRVGRYRFCPLRLDDVKTIVDHDMVATVESALKCYVQKNGKPIESCTIVLRARHPQAWNIPREHWNHASSAAKTLALACLSEQRFLEGHFSPHLNATMFHLVGQGVIAGSDQIAPTSQGVEADSKLEGCALRTSCSKGRLKSKAPTVIQSTTNS